MAFNTLLGGGKEVPMVQNGVPAHLRVITTSSAHVMFAGNFEKTIRTVCDHTCRYHRTLVSIEDPINSDVGNVMDTAFQLAGDLALFEETIRIRCTTEQATSRVALAFGDACARARDRPHDRVIVVAIDPFLIEELQFFLENNQMSHGVAHVIDVRTTLPPVSREGPQRAKE